MILTEDVIQEYRASQGYVYLIHASGTNRYKIGRSVNPVARFETLKKQSPYPLQIIECFWTPDAIADESELHKFFKDERVHGEWFDFQDKDEASIISFVDKVKTRFDFWRPVAVNLAKQSWGKVLNPVLRDEYYRSLFDVEFLKKVEQSNIVETPTCLFELFHKPKSLETFQLVYNFSFDKLPQLFIRFIEPSLLENDSWCFLVEGAVQSAALMIFGEML
jgi:hypothetical protein